MIQCSFGKCKVASLILYVFFIWVFGSAVQPSTAVAFTEESSYELGLRYGYGQTCKARETIRFNSFMPRWGVFLTQPDNPILGKLRLSFILEGLVGSMHSDNNTGWDIGFTPLLKISYPMGRVLAYIEGGAGMIWENIDSPTYAHAFNFSPQVGAGVDIKLIGNYALTVAYRFRHTSNAGLYAENPGVDSNFIMAGVSYYF
jgi:opacity protein-like surface antigen